MFQCFCYGKSIRYKIFSQFLITTTMLQNVISEEKIVGSYVSDG